MTKRYSTLYRLFPAGALLVAFLLFAGTAQAQTELWLVAQPYTKVMGDGSSVPMWGYAQADAGFTNVQAPASPGPFLTVTSAPLTIHLRNQLPVPVSIMIPAMPGEMTPVKFTDGTGRERVRSFTAETAPGADGTYTWDVIRDGTFLYTSGTHVQVQVQMGLYGGLKVETAPGQAYPGIPYDAETVMLYSEIDPVLHLAVDNGTYGTPAYPSTVQYKPTYYLVNGLPYSAAQAPAIAGTTGQTVLVRFLNAGLKSKVPMMLGGHWNLVADDGNPYPHPKIQYNAFLPAGKTLDATLVFAADGSFPVVDKIGYGTTNVKRDLNLDGAYTAADLIVLLAYLNGTATPGVAPFNSILSAADLNNDGLVDSADALLMAGELAGTILY